MAIALVQHNSGISASATVNPAFSVASTSGNLVVLGFASDDYNGTVDTGWTQSSEMEQQGFHGGYLWWRISTGQTSFTYTIGSAANSAWALAEFSGVDATPYDTSQGVFVNTGASNYTSDPITPTAGNRLVVAVIGGSGAGGVSTPSSFTNSFNFINGNNTGNTASTDDATAMAYRLLTPADGSTSYTTTATYTPNVSQSRSALMISFKEAAAPWSPNPEPATAGLFDPELRQNMWF